MGKVSKATKKFQSKHLKDALEQRKKNKIEKKRREGRRGNKTEEEKKAKALTKEEQKMKKSSKDEVFRDMPVDEFFEKGIELPKENKKLKKKQAESKGDSSDESSSDEEGDINMDELSKNDPEFFKYLEENDKDLLDFAGSNPLDGVDDNEEEEDDNEEQQIDSDSDIEGKEEERKANQIELTHKLVKQWKTQLRESPSLKLIRNVVSAFKMAINLNRDEDTEEYKYAVTDEKAFQELMFIALKDLPAAVQKLVPYKETKGTRTLPSNKTVTKLSSIIKSHAAALLTFIADITNTESAALALHSVNSLMPYFISYRRILKELIKNIVEVWSTTKDVETQIATFAFLHSASKEFKKAILELVLKTTYSTFIKSCRRTNIRTMPLINFQKNSAAELFGIDEVVSYQVGFEYIRQLAIHLRNTINSTTKKTSKGNPAEAYKIVYNWQFCHSLDFWSRVLSFSCNPEKEGNHESPLRQLIYPLVQVTLGAARLIPTPQFFPLRFYLIRSMIRMSQNTAVFIPIYLLLSEILSSTAFTRNPKKSQNLVAFDFDHNIKCTAAYLGTRTYQEGLCEQFIDLVGEYLVLYSKSVAFPELATPVVISLRRYAKTSKNIKFNKQLLNIVEKLNQNIRLIEDKRSKIDFGPNNKTEVARFLNELPWEKTPLGAYVVVQREVREEKNKLLRESLEESEDDKSDDDENVIEKNLDDEDSEDEEMSE